LQESGEMYVSNAVIRGKFVLRACIVNFRSSLADVDALPVAVVRMGRQLDFSLRPKALQTNE
jgi:aromatic-L-amino-acid decarboxylase